MCEATGTAVNREKPQLPEVAYTNTVGGDLTSRKKIKLVLRTASNPHSQYNSSSAFQKSEAITSTLERMAEKFHTG